MLRNIFQGETNELFVENEETEDPLTNEDYLGYYRIKDGVDNGQFPNDEFQSFWHKYTDTPSHDGTALMEKWWKVFYMIQRI